MINLLVVEDDAKLNAIVCKYLSDSGYSVTGCADPSAAYDEMYHGSYDLILSDIMMPGIDGFEFAEAVRRINEQIPIIFMTARDDFASKQKGFRLLLSYPKKTFSLVSSLPGFLYGADLSLLWSSYTI